MREMVQHHCLMLETSNISLRILAHILDWWEPLQTLIPEAYLYQSKRLLTPPEQASHSSHLSPSPQRSSALIQKPLLGTA